MPPGEELRVRPEDLVAHAARIGTVAGQVETARQAGEAVRPSADAYGRLCTIVPILLGGLQDLVVDGIDAAADSLRDTGERLRITARGYESTDAGNAADLNRARSGR
jgi:hypothetical protein